MTQELKPCPCCGGEAKTNIKDANEVWCSCGLSVNKFSIPEAIEAWNKRYEIKQVLAILEKGIPEREGWKYLNGSHDAQEASFIDGQRWILTKIKEIKKSFGGKRLTLVTEKEVTESFGYASFGIKPLDVIKYGLLKSTCGYYHGHTSTSILQELGLITDKCNITKRGRYNLYKWFVDEEKTP